MQRHIVDRLEPRAAALYLFLVTVENAHGLSQFGAATLAQRPTLSANELGAARSVLFALERLAYQAPLYQGFALPGIALAARPAPSYASLATATPTSPSRGAAGPVSLTELLAQLERQGLGVVQTTRCRWTDAHGDPPSSDCA